MARADRHPCHNSKPDSRVTLVTPKTPVTHNIALKDPSINTLNTHPQSTSSILQNNYYVMADPCYFTLHLTRLPPLSKANKLQDQTCNETNLPLDNTFAKLEIKATHLPEQSPHSCLRRTGAEECSNSEHYIQQGADTQRYDGRSHGVVRVGDWYVWAVEGLVARKEEKDVVAKDSDKDSGQTEQVVVSAWQTIWMIALTRVAEIAGCSLDICQVWVRYLLRDVNNQNCKPCQTALSISTTRDECEGGSWFRSSSMPQTHRRPC